MDEFPLQCPSCKQSYSDILKPRNLQCGHSVCSVCAADEILNKKHCPECRCKSIVKAISDLPFNYPLSCLIRSYGKGCASFKNKRELFQKLNQLAIKGKNAGTCLSHDSPLCFLCITCSSWVCEDCLVIDHRDLPRGSCRTFGIQDAINLIRLEFRKRRDTFLEEMKSLKRKREPESHIHNLCIKYCRIDPNSHKKIVTKINTELEEIKKKDDIVIKNSIKKINNISKVVNKTSSPTEISSTCKDFIECQESFMKHATEEVMTQSVHMSILEHLKMDITRTAMDMSKPLYAVQQEGGHTQWSLVTHENRGILLHSLRDGLPPDDGINLPYKYLRELIPSELPKVFLKVACENKDHDVVYIRLFSDRFLVNQTLTLFSGEKGSSFRGTCFFKHDEYDILHGGDFLNNDGSAKVFRGIGYCGEEEPREKFIKSGTLEVDPCIKNRLYFQLLSRRHDLYSPIGEIMRGGLGILRAAAKVTPIEKSGIRDCGLYIPVSRTMRHNL